MKKLLFFCVLIFIAYNANAQRSVKLSQLYFTKQNHTYEIKDVMDLHGDTVYLPKGCRLNFDGGTIKNGTVFSPFGSNVIISGSVKADKVNFYGDFVTDQGQQLTYKLDTISRPFKVYHPFAPSYPIQSGIEAYHLSGSEGAFVIYHVSNKRDGKVSDDVFLNGNDAKYVKDKKEDIVSRLIKPLIANRVNVVGLMFHTEGGWDDSYYSKNIAKNYSKYILDKVDLFRSYFPMLRIIYISNEQPWFAPDKDPWSKSYREYVPNQKQYQKGWQSCLLDLTRQLHKRNLKAGFKFAGYDDGVSSVSSMNKSLLSNVDYLSVNFYPWSGDVDKKKLFDKWQMDFYTNGLLSFVNALKAHGKEQPLTLTEIGTLPYRESLPAPWQYTKLNIHDNSVVDIHVATVRKILSRMPCKTDFIVYWFLSALDEKLGITPSTMDEVYKSFLK